jgi:chromosome segregation ATPase
MAEPPPKRRRALLDYVGNEIDHLEKENDELRREVERIRTDMAELKRLDGLRAKDIFDLNMQNRALEKKIRDKDVDLDEEKDAVRELWSQIEALKSQNSLPSEEKELVRELRQQNEVLARRNTLLVATMQEIREISQEGTPIKIYTSSEPSKNPSLKISAEKLWENRLGSLSLGLLGELLQSIYNQDFKSRLGITVVRDMIARVHRESKQQVSICEY